MARAFFVPFVALETGCAEGGRPDAVSFGEDLTQSVMVFVTRWGFLPGTTGLFLLLAGSGKMRGRVGFSLSVEIWMLLRILYTNQDIC